MQDYCEKERSCNGLDVRLELQGNELSRMDEIRKEFEESINPLAMGSECKQTLQET